MSAPIRVHVLHCSDGNILFSRSQCGSAWKDYVAMPVAEFAELREFVKQALEDAVIYCDHACSECVPGGDLVIVGARCVRHKAMALLETGVLR